jgi:hypothetical protein
MQKPRLKGFSWALKAKYCKTYLCYLLYLASVFSFLALGLNSTELRNRSLFSIKMGILCHLSIKLCMPSGLRPRCGPSEYPYPPRMIWFHLLIRTYSQVELRTLIRNTHLPLADSVWCSIFSQSISALIHISTLTRYLFLCFGRTYAMRFHTHAAPCPLSRDELEK